jgi:hypothetical protein
LGVDITLAHGTDAETQTSEQLRGLLERYDLSPWEYTVRVLIDERSIPHSHPVLTLHTRHRNDDLLLLSTYLHEQLHWFIWRQPDERIEPAIAALMERYPQPPVGFPQGAETLLSTDLHYLVCYLEYLSLRRIVGEREARRAISFWMDDHYTEIYRTVMADMDAIEEIARRYDLIPGFLLAGGG